MSWCQWSITTMEKVDIVEADYAQGQRHYTAEPADSAQATRLDRWSWARVIGKVGVSKERGKSSFFYFSAIGCPWLDKVFPPSPPPPCHSMGGATAIDSSEFRTVVVNIWYKGKDNSAQLINMVGHAQWENVCISLIGVGGFLLLLWSHCLSSPSPGFNSRTWRSIFRDFPLADHTLSTRPEPAW